MLQVSLDRERSERLSVEGQLRERTRELSEMQARYDAMSREWGTR